MNPYRIVSENSAIPIGARHWARTRAYLEDENHDPSLPQSGCPIAAVLSREDVPVAVRAALVAFLNRPVKVRVETSTEDLSKLLDRCGCYPECRRQVGSTLIHSVRAGDDLSIPLTQLKKNRPQWFR